MFGERENGTDGRAGTVGTDFQASTQLPQAFAHANKPHAELGSARPPVKRLQDLGWNAVASVFHFQTYLAGLLQEPNGCGPAAGMPVNIAERFLEDPEQRQLSCLGQLPKLRRNLLVHAQPAALRKAVGVLPHRVRQP